MTDEVPKGPPPVEPMPDVAWARVERGLMARLDSPALGASPPPNRRWIWIAVPALAAAAAAVILLVARREDPTPAPDPIATIEPSRVVAGDAPSSVTFADAHVALDAHSAMVMTYEAQSPSVLLERGAAAFTVAPRGGRAPFIVRAGDTVVRVVGTQFRVARSEERVAVEVEHGIVDVQFRGNTVRVDAGHAWSSESPAVVSQIALAAPVPIAPPIAAPATEPPVAPPPAIAKPTADKPSKPSADACAVDPECTKYYRMLAAEQRDPAAALAGYLELSKGSSKWAAVGLYAAGRLAADRGDRRATTFLKIYLRRFPAGPNANDARTLLQRLQGENR